METVIGIENLKNQFRKAKLMCGDLRGLKNSFSLSEKLGVPALQTWFFKSGGNGEERMELTADCYMVNGTISIHAYTMKGLIEDMKNETELYEVYLVCLKWNKHRTDADRRTVLEFLYKNS